MLGHEPHGIGRRLEEAGFVRVERLPARHERERGGQGESQADGPQLTLIFGALGSFGPPPLPLASGASTGGKPFKRRQIS